MPETPLDPDMLPEAAVVKKSRAGLAIVWLVPVIALLIGGWLAVRTILERGPTVTLVFKQAEGLEAGKTRIKYKDVDIGLVTAIGLSQDLQQVIVTAEMKKDFARHLVEDTRFWVVRARISGGNVSGLGTLLSGSYIGVDVGKSDKDQRHFNGLESPPLVQIDSPGREFTLRSADLGSLEIGSPILFRRIPVGQITSYKLDGSGKGVLFTTFIHAPYDRFVTANTRFWNASGVDLSLDAGGVKLNTQSLVSLLLGGVAFEDPADDGAAPADANHEFKLFDNRALAMKNPETKIFRIAMSFNESVRGLVPGAPVNFRGIDVGEVTSLHADVDPVSKQTFIVVDANLYPERMQSRMRSKSGQATGSGTLKELDLLVEKGLRAQLQTGNLLTGQLIVALDFLPKAPKARVDWSHTPPVLPTAASSLQSLQQTLDSITRKIDRLPIEQIGTGLEQTLRSANALLHRFDAELVPESSRLLREARDSLQTAEKVLSSQSPLQQDARAAMRELSKAAQAFRILADTLERHPEALLRGKPEDPK